MSDWLHNLLLRMTLELLSATAVLNRDHCYLTHRWHFWDCAGPSIKGVHAGRGDLKNKGRAWWF